MGGFFLIIENHNGESTMNNTMPSFYSFQKGILCFLLITTAIIMTCNLARAIEIDTGEKAAQKEGEEQGQGQEYLIGLGDVIEVNVWKEAELSRTITVRMDGRISLPLLGDEVAAGRTSTELALQIQKRLSEFMTEPPVSVILNENHSRRYFVIGQVNKPGEYLIDFPLTVLQAIARSGGFLEWAKTSDIAIIRRESGQEKRIVYDYDIVVKGKDLKQNILVAPGDVIVIP